MTEREILREAIQVLRENDWTSGTLRDGDRFCAVGAILEAGGALINEDGSGYYTENLASPNWEPCMEVAVRAQKACERRTNMWLTLEEWNDNYAESKEEVIGLLEETLRAMEIGTERETVVIEPIESPVPQEAPSEAPEPVEVPDEVPELVPA